MNRNKQQETSHSKETIHKFYTIFAGVYYECNLMHFLNTGTVALGVYAIDQIVGMIQYANSIYISQGYPEKQNQ